MANKARVMFGHENDIANNKLSENRAAIALSRNAQPVLRQNLIAKNTQGGLSPLTH